MAPDRGDGDPAARAFDPRHVMWEELRDHSEQRWGIEGPNSGGGKTLYRYKGYLFTVGYGDWSSHPGGAEEVISIQPDNSPGFPPWTDGGHTAGCLHHRETEADFWTHEGASLHIGNGQVRLSDAGVDLWTCPLDAFLLPRAPQRDHVARLLGPAVLEEALRCATHRWFGVTYRELRARAEGSWKLEGPSSKGGTDVYRYRGRLFIVGYGESSPLPDGAEEVIGVRADNTPGFPPAMDGGHAAGCTHSRPFESDSWGHRTSLLMIHRGLVQLFQDAREVWTCPIDAWAEPGSEYRAKVLEVFGPAVLEEAVRCARGRLPAR
jgi:hypothetical protein